MTDLDKFIQKRKLKKEIELCKKPICFTDMSKIHKLLCAEAQEKELPLYEVITRRGLKNFLENPKR